MKLLVNIRGLSKWFGKFPALGDVNFDIFEHEILGLIGPNGAGKTTLLECLAGLLQADSGSVLWEKAPLAPERRKERIFYLPDGIAPLGDHTVLETLTFFANMRGQSAEDIRWAVEKLELGALWAKRIKTLSKGTLKRVLLAIAVTAPQPVIFLDEPFDGLDLRQTRAAMSLLKDIRALPRTLVLSIHQLPDAERICDRFVLLRSGRPVGNGSLEQLRERAGLSSGSLEETFLALT